MILAFTVFDLSTRVTDGRTELQWLRCATAVAAVACENTNMQVIYDKQKESWLQSNIMTL